MSIEKQNKDLLNTLITVAETSSDNSNIPIPRTKAKTIALVLYEVLKERPYELHQYDLFYEVHINRMNKELIKLKLETYKLQRSELCSLFGWGFHGDENGKIGLVAVESDKYNELLNDSRIKKKKAYNKS